MSGVVGEWRIEPRADRHFMVAIGAGLLLSAQQSQPLPAQIASEVKLTIQAAPPPISKPPPSSQPKPLPVPPKPKNHVEPRHVVQPPKPIPQPNLPPAPSQGQVDAFWLAMRNAVQGGYLPCLSA